MLLKFINIILLLGALAGPQNELPVHFERRIDKALKPILKTEEISYTFIDSTAGADLYQLKAEDMFHGYMAIASSKGRFERFYYMIYYADDLSVQKVKIIQYNSTRGTEVASKRWLKQFEGNKGEELRYGKDVNAISGATYSATSITKDIPVVTKWVQSVVREIQH